MILNKDINKKHNSRQLKLLRNKRQLNKNNKKDKDKEKNKDKDSVKDKNNVKELKINKKIKIEEIDMKEKGREINKNNRKYILLSPRILKFQ